MKPERLDVTSEELEALLEGARAPLGEVSYQKLQAAIRTLGYVTELLETRRRRWRNCAGCCATPARRRPERC